MRALTASQKKLIREYIHKYKMRGEVLNTIDDLTSDEYAALEKINDTEVLWQNVNRYISDENIAALYK